MYREISLWLVFIPLVTFFSSFVCAQEKPSPPAPTDYAVALEKLAALNISAVPEGAKWIAGSPYESMRSQVSYGSSSPYKTKHKGKGWFVPQRDSQPAMFVPSGACNAVKLTEQQARKMLAEKEIDLLTDTELMIDAIQKIAAADADDLRSFFGYQDGFTTTAELMVFAARLNQLGKKDLANRIVTAIMGVGLEYQVQHVDRAITLLADDELKRVTDAFFSTYDWGQFEQQLQQIIKKYPRGWEKLSAVIMLRDHVIRRKNPPPTVKITDPELAAFIGQLHETRPSSKKNDNDRRSMRMGGYEEYYSGQSPLMRNWILFPLDKKDGDDAMSQVQAKGFSAIPALVALLEDDYLTLYPMESNGNQGYSRFSSNEKSADEIFKEMERPMTRGELSFIVLSAVLPTPYSDRPEEPGELAAVALDFYERMKNADQNTILLDYLKSDSYQHIALERLTKSDDPATIAALEKFILAAESPVDYYDTVFKIMKGIKKPSKEFLASYKTKLQQQYDASQSDTDRMPYEFRRDGGIKSLMSKLDNLSGNFTPTQLMMKVVMADDKKWKSVMELFAAELPNLKKDEAIALCVKGAATALSGEKAASFLENIYRLRDEEDEKLRDISPAELELWKKVLTTPKSFYNEQTAAMMEIPTLAAYALEYSLSIEGFGMIHRYQGALSVNHEQFVMQRGLARVNAQPTPELPDPKKVTKERFAEIIASLENQSPVAVHEKIEKLSSDEKAAWIDWIADPVEPVAPESVKNAIFVVTGRLASKQYGKDEPAIDGLANNSPISAETLVKWGESTFSDIAAKAPSVSMAMVDHSMKIGVRVFSSKADFSTKKNVGDNSFAEMQLQQAMEAFSENEKLEAITIIKVAKFNDEVTLTWEKEAGKVERVDDVTNEKMAEQFEFNFEEMTKSGSGSPWYVIKSTLRKEDYLQHKKAYAAQLKAREDSGDDEDEEE